MKILIAAIVIVVGAGGVFSFNAAQQSALQEQQLTGYEKQVIQLLSQVEDYSVLRLEHEKQIQQLNSQLTTTSSQLTALSNQLQIVQQKVNPDYQKLENEIRQRLNREIQSQSTNTGSRASLIRQMASLGPMELGELMSLNGQYGGFLSSLNVSDERMEVIVDALGNYITEQNQRRMEIIQEMQSQPKNSDPLAMRSLMANIGNLEDQLESLSYDLTESELAAFSAYQEQRQSGFGSFAVSPNGGPVNQFIMSGDAGRVMTIGELRAPGAVQIFPAVPLN
ncbi:MAG: hypothetical protein COA96_11205 [SAR86 cluster bacterium]|uniref:Uncharacterized protein n=1 Tax=SAR86 cluster bacterium TaxID=2030880 RepID=A0A2A5AWT1_9GAMM|nr:MAG: hypothetical protein COA96_11205 [SAR86 cluster bacterium]